ncbi:MAG: hypothetical protein WKF75_16420 [Singulisphaera sp.]
MTPQARVAAAPLALFASIYAVQGIVVAYFFNFNKAYMIGAGVDERLVGGVESLVLLPFVFKFLVGPLSDRMNLLGWGHRKPYILVGIVLQTAGLIGLAAVDPAGTCGGSGPWPSWRSRGWRSTTPAAMAWSSMSPPPATARGCKVC